MLFKVIKVFSYIVLVLFFLSFFGNYAKKASQGQNVFGSWTEGFRTFIDFPDVMESVQEEVTNIPETYVKVKTDFVDTNSIDYDVFALNAHYDFSGANWIFELKNLKDGNKIHQWQLNQKDFHFTKRQFSNSEPRSSILLADKSIIAICDESYNLFRLDSASNILWHNTENLYHHSLNLGPDGHIWACSKEKVWAQFPHYGHAQFWDNHLVQIDAQTGEVLYKKSVTDILMDNGYPNYVYGMGNDVFTSGKDPLHLNDIEVVFSDGPHWKKGDVFISLRHRSLVFLYRPSTNRILRLIQGPFLSQHDVDIISEHEISIFNNNYPNFSINWALSEEEKKDATLFENPFNCSHIIQYNFADSTFQYSHEKALREECFLTLTQGLHEHLSNGDLFLENQNQGIIYIMDKEHTLLRQYPNPIKEGATERPHWTRVYEELPF